MRPKVTNFRVPTTDQFSRAVDTRAATGGAALSRAGAVAGAADGGVAGGSGPVLGGDRPGDQDRGRRARGRSVVSGRVPVVPSRWRREPLSAVGGVGSVSVVLRARGHYDLPCAGPGRAGDRPPAGAQPVDDLAGAAAECIDSDVAAGVQGVDRAVACRTSGSSTEGGPRLATNDRLREYVQDRLSGVVRTVDGRVVGPPGPTWNGKNKPHRADRRWVQGWSPSRSPTGCRWTSPMMRPCGSATRRSTRLCMSRAGVRSSATWSTACAPAVPCGFRGHDPGRRLGRTSHPRC